MPKKYFCYCIGGTGARVAEAAAHLCAMNMINADQQEEIEFIIVDKDKECGGTEQAKHVIGSAAALSPNANNLQRSGLVNGQGQHEFCKNYINVNTNWDFTSALARLKERNAGGVQNAGTISLKDAVSRTNNNDDKVLMNAFYTQKEQNIDTDKGFYGDPSVGSLIFKYMVKNDGNQNDIANPVTGWLGQHANAGDEARVFIIGSIFGGTGAAIFSNLAAHLRDSANVGRLFISGVLLLPYFSFGDGGQNAKVNSAEFFKKSKVALDEYNRDLNLIRTVNNPNGSFDSLYVCGQYECHMTSENYADGGKYQNNHFDLVDLVAASAMVDFFNKDFPANNGQIVGLGKIYEYRFGVQTATALQEVKLEDINELLDKMQQMLLFSAFVVIKGYGQYLLNERADPKTVYENVTMIKRLFDRSEITGRNNNFTAVKNDANALLRSVYSYCKEYIRLVYDIARNGMNWNAQMPNAAYKLFSERYTADLKRICDDIDVYNADNAESVKALKTEICNFLKSSQDIRDNVTSNKTVASVETELGDIFAIGGMPYLGGISRVYHGNDGISPKMRFLDYIDEAYKACQGV